LYASDGLCGDLDGDGIPEVAVGRLPARTPAELSGMIAKIRDYETEFGTDWQQEVVLAADRYDPDAGDFAAANTQLSGLVDDPFNVAMQLDLDTTAITPARTHLQDRFKAGASFRALRGACHLPRVSVRWGC
jgi:hypothetical protein